MALFFLCVGGEKKIKNLCHECCVDPWQAGVSCSWAGLGTRQVLAGLRSCFALEPCPAQ